MALRADRHGWWMMLVVLAPLWQGCARCSSSVADTQTEAGALTQGSFQVGDRVVVEVARASFIEAVVESVGKSRLRIKPAGQELGREVDLADAYPVQKPGADWTPGALGICQMQPQSWAACRVQQVRAEQKLLVVDEEGQEHELLAAQVLRPTALTELNMRQSFERAVQRKRFLEELKDAGLPLRPAGWKPQAGQPVIVRVGGTYFGGRITQVRKDGALVQVQDGGPSATRAIGSEDLYPQPPQSFEPSVGMFACARPRAGQLAWTPVRISAVAGGKVTVVDQNGEQRAVELPDLTPLRK